MKSKNNLKNCTPLSYNKIVQNELSFEGHVATKLTLQVVDDVEEKTRRDGQLDASTVRRFFFLFFVDSYKEVCHN